VTASSRETVESVMSFVANIDAVIFDLRKNAGGSADIIAVIEASL